MNTVIISLNWNGTYNTIQLLQSYNSFKIPYPIWIIDNGSDDDNTEIFKKTCPFVEVIKLDKNYGFAGGMNRAINLAIEAGYQYVYEINNDCLFTNDAVSPLIKAAENNPKLALLGSRYLERDNKGNFTQGGFLSSQNESYLYDETGILFLNKVVGCGMLINCHIYKEVGGMEESYFCYAEENDYCYKLLRNGYKLGMCFHSLIYHKHEQSNINANSSYYRTRNLFLLFRRNRDQNVPFVDPLKNLIKQAIKSNDKRIKIATGEGFIHGVIGSFGKRNNLKRNLLSYYTMLLLSPFVIVFYIIRNMIYNIFHKKNKSKH